MVLVVCRMDKREHSFLTFLMQEINRLVDLAEKDAKFDQWLKEVAPSANLHQRFGSHPNVAKRAEFEQCYRAELQGSTRTRNPSLESAFS